MGPPLNDDDDDVGGGEGGKCQKKYHMNINASFQLPTPNIIVNYLTT